MSFNSTSLVMILLLFAMIIGLYLVNSEEPMQAHATTEHEDLFEVGLNHDRDYLILVNENHPYEFGGEYDEALKNDLIYVSDTVGEPTPIEKGANLAFSLLKQRLRDSAGIDIELYSCYRTKEDQEWVLDQYGDFEGGSSPGAQNVALPGRSEHHTGLLLDIQVRRHINDKDVWTTQMPTSSEETYRIIRDNLPYYGFIERYPSGKEGITGIACRPNEIRFVGSSKVAHEIMDNNLCLEEYLAQKNK